MNELANTLRMYAEDIHSAVGCSDCSTAISQAADKLEDIEEELDRIVLAVADHVTARCELAAQNVALRSAIEALQGNSCGDNSDAICADALNLPDIASEVLKRRDAVMLRRAAEVFEKIGYMPWHPDVKLREMAAETEKETT